VGLGQSPIRQQFCCILQLLVTLLNVSAFFVVKFYRLSLIDSTVTDESNMGTMVHPLYQVEVQTVYKSYFFHFYGGTQYKCCHRVLCIKVHQKVWLSVLIVIIRLKKTQHHQKTFTELVAKTSPLSGQERQCSNLFDLLKGN